MKRLRLWLIERLMPPTHYLAERKPAEHFATFAYKPNESLSVFYGDHVEGVREFMLKDGVLTELTASRSQP